MNIEELVVAHAPWIRKKASYYCMNSADADDLASETIYKCLSRGRHFNMSRNFKPWALAVMVNTYITLYNRRRCILFTGYNEALEYSGGERADQRASVRNLLSVIRRCRCKSETVDAVLLYAKGYSYMEIADMLEIPVGTVRSRISTARKLLRANMS